MTVLKLILLVLTSTLLTVTLSFGQALTADAGPAADQVCQGDGIVLGGNPSVSGGSGFYMISWSSSPPGFNSSASNPVATPTVNTVYTITVTDSDGNMASDNISVTVNPRTDPADLDIVFTPQANSYSIEDDPVDLSYTVAGGGSGTGIFSGDGVNSTSNKFYPGAANPGVNDVNLRFTNASGCETSITEKVNVYDPNGFLGGLDASYCPYGDDDLTVNVPPPYVSFVDIFLSDPSGTDIPAGSSWTKSIPARTVHLNLDLLPIGKSTFRIVYTVTGIIGYSYTPYLDLTCLCVRYNATPIYGPVQTDVFVSLIINPQPETKIAFKAKAPEFCRNDTPVNMEGGPAGGIWQGNGIAPAPGNDNNPVFSSGDNGLATFDPAAAAIGNNTIRYIFQDDNGCRDTTQVDFKVFALPAVDFTAPNGCVGTQVEFDPSITIPGSVSVTGYIWDFDDDRREVSPTLSDPTYHTYSSSNDYDVMFGAFTSDGCLASVTKPVSIGDVPDVKLSWSSVCDGDPTRFSIKSNFFNSNPSDLNRLTWDFGDGNNVVKANPVLADTVQLYAYGSTGYFNVSATLESDLGCTNSISVPAYKVAKTGIINGSSEYLQDFNALTFDEQEWVTGGNNSSWEWGIPSNTYINDDEPGGGKAWVTNLSGSFNINEDSWVHSPCMDLSQIQRPVFSMDIRSLTRNQIEGAVLQINSTTSTDRESDWKTVGNTSTGINWYNETGIFSNPGNQTLNQTGWTGLKDSVSWRPVTIALDNVLAPLSSLERSRVRFRVAFSSPVDSSSSPAVEGFAFDNIRIAQRDRVVLLESFSNSGGPNTANEPNKVSNNTVNNFVSGTTGETVKLEYHISQSGPNPDPIYLDNPADANARAAFYGVTSTPFVFLDGDHGSNILNKFANQTLKSAGAKIDTIFTTAAPAESLNIVVTFTAKIDLPPGTVLQVAVIEKKIFAAEALGSNGEDTLRFVMKKMLPGARGTVFPSGLLKGTSRTVNVSWYPQAYDVNKLAVIAFLQNENTGEVYQARLLDTPQYIPANVVTGLEPAFTERIVIFPVPADREVQIALPSSYPREVMCRLYDSFGKEIALEVFRIGEQNKRFRTNELSEGVYILQLEAPGEPVSRKKLLVVHRQGQ